MKTTYQILWIDDELLSTDTDRMEVEEFFENYGIKANIAAIEAPDDGSIYQLIEHYLQEPELDLLMVDFNMDGLSGDKLISLIRNTDHVYLPVIFYSSSPSNVIYDAARNASLDGVYIANRRFLLNKVKDVAKSLLNKEHTTKRTRGLLMEGVSEIDATFRELFEKCWSNLNIEQRAVLISYLAAIIQDRADRAQDSFENFPTEERAFYSHMTESFLSVKYDSYTRWRIVKKMLSLLEHNSAQVSTLSEFGNAPEGKVSLNKLRNIYAHSTRKDLEKDHSTEKCIDIRKALRGQTGNVAKIISRLG